MRHTPKPLAIALGATFALAGLNAATAFAAQDLASGYMVASLDDKKPEHSCGEAKCGANQKAKSSKAAEKSCGADKKAEHGCGADKKAEHSCGADKKTDAAAPAAK